MSQVQGRALQGRLLRFVITGTGAAGLFVVLASLFTGAGVPPLLGGAIAYLMAFAFAYLTHRSWTFGGEQPHITAFPRYFALQLGCAALSGAVSHIAVHWYDAAPFAMSVAAVMVSSAVSYVLSSRWVFARNDA